MSGKWEVKKKGGNLRDRQEQRGTGARSCEK